ncbi:MAG: lipoyl synthase [Desulfobacteraceae bacterium]|nr:lipoyl synthase [Desulfobacteraceae bacterium]
MASSRATSSKQKPVKKPDWLKRRLPSGPAYEQTRRLIKNGCLHTVCQEANCPNMFECFSKHTATFLILGGLCTRKCAFCNVQHGPKELPDPREPTRVAQAAAQMKLNYIVITSVTRDDLPDGGAGLFAETIRATREKLPGSRIEVLIPDFQGNRNALQTVLDARPDVLNHNIETVPRLYDSVRPQADYRRSLTLLADSARIAPDIPTKSGLMLGLGETEPEIEQSLQDLRKTGCRIVTMGQYLQPTAKHHPVKQYVSPEQFEQWHRKAIEIGFSEASCGPFVRSSYEAKDTYSKVASIR